MMSDSSSDDFSSSESESTDDFFDESESESLSSSSSEDSSDSDDSLEEPDYSIPVFSSFFMRRPSDFICIKAPAPEGDYLWEVSLFPFNQVTYVKRNDRWRYAQVIFSCTLRKTEELFQDVIKIMDKAYRYVSNHPDCRSGPYDRCSNEKIGVKSFIDIWDYTCPNNYGVHSNYFWRKERGCIWIRAPAPLGDLLLEMNLYPYQDIAGIRKQDRWRFAKMNLSHTINTTSSTYRKLIPIIKSVNSQIRSHPAMTLNESENIDEIDM